MMKRIVPALLVLAALASGCEFKTGPLPPIDVYFSPKGGATEAVVQALDAAKNTVFVQAYSFTSKEIAEALLHAHKRGVVIHVILDKSDVGDHYSEADFLANSGISVLIDAKHQIAHNKIMIIDGETVITGSFNFTRQAEEHNAENLLGDSRPRPGRALPGELARSRSPQRTLHRPGRGGPAADEGSGAPPEKEVRHPGRVDVTAWICSSPSKPHAG